MSDIKSLLSEEDINSRFIHLHKEGLFYVAYEHSCYAFHHYIKPFKVSKRFVKLAGQEVVKLGFPSSNFEKLMSGRNYEQLTEKHVTIPLTDEEMINEAAFSEWKKALPMQERKGMTQLECQSQEDGITDSDSLARMILSFPLESRTPMECMYFLSDLKKTVMNLQVL